MANNTYTKKITDNYTIKSQEYTSQLAQINDDIKALDLTVNKTVNTEIDRLISLKEKERFMNSDSKNKNELDKKISSLKSDEFFKIIGESATSITDADTYALKVLKPSDLERPSVISEPDWNAKTLQEKKQSYLTDIKSNKMSKYEEYVFLGMPEDIKRQKITQDANVYFDMLSTDKKLELISIYGEMDNIMEGKDSSFEDKLNKAQKRKDQKKLSIKNNANKLIASMLKIIDDNANDIKKLQSEIEKEEKELNDLKNKPVDIAEFAKFYQAKNSKLDMSDIDKLKDMANTEREKAITKKEAYIAEMKTDLGTAITEHNTATVKLQKSITELENYLAGKNIYVGSQSINEKDIKPQPEPTRQSTTASVNSTNKPNSKDSQTKRAAQMLEDMIGKYKRTGTINTIDFKNMLHSNYYEQLISGASQLRGKVNKNDITKFYEVAWEDFMHDTDKGLLIKINNILGTKINGGFKLDDLKNISDLTEKQIKNLEYLIRDHISSYSNATKQDQEIIDALMDFVKIGMLTSQAEHGNFFTDHFGKFFKVSKKNLRLGNLVDLLEEHSNIYGKRQSNIYGRLNKMRSKLNLPPVDISDKVVTPKALNKGKTREHTL